MKKLIILILLLSEGIMVKSQLVIHGPKVVLRGETAMYEVFGNSPGSLLNWNVYGATSYSGYDFYGMVEWGAQYGIGSIYITDMFGNSASMDVLIGGPYITPSESLIQHGQPPVQLCVHSLGGTFQWQRLYDFGGWGNISGAYGDCYIAEIPIGESNYYRCVVTIDGVEYITNVAEIKRSIFKAGTISVPSTPLYNQPVIVNSTPSTGGSCFEAGRKYTWEMSVENSGWEAIGNTETYPATNRPVSGMTKIRRKVECGPDKLYSNTVTIFPQYVFTDSENRNYVRTFTVATKGIRSIYQADELELGKKFQETVYFDGLGRSIQTVNKGVSSISENSTKDLVTFTLFDNLGRAPKEYFPYTTESLPGKFKTNLVEQQTFYATNYNEVSPWSSTEFETNPLSRVVKMVGGGNVLQQSGKDIKFEYGFNNSNNGDERVHIWTIGYEPDALPSTTPNAFYTAGKLSRNVTTDEEGLNTIEYTDFEGNLILKKTQIAVGGTLSQQHEGWLCTYYVYDDFQQVRFIITPKAVKYLDANNWVMSRDIANELCFEYSYDNKGRVISKRSPGAGKQSLIYDLQNRVIFVQDARQAAKTSKEWLATIYDELGRPVTKGIFISALEPDQLQSMVDNAAEKTYMTYPMGYSVNQLVVDKRLPENPIQRYIATELVELVPDFTSLENDEFVVEIDPLATSHAFHIPVFKSGTSLVDQNNSQTFTALTYYYFDNYLFADAKNFDNGYLNTEAYASGQDIEQIIPTTRTRDMVTGMRVRVLGSSNFLTTTMYYDENGANIQTFNDHIKNGFTVTTTQYRFNGLVMSVHTRHRSAGNAFDNFSVINKHLYDKFGRLIGVHKKFGNGAFRKISEYSYDEFSRVRSKSLGVKPGTTAALEEQVFSYNSRGQLIGINKEYALATTNPGQWEKYFGLYLGYHNETGVFARNRFDLRLTGTVWRSQGDNRVRKYDFQYDNAGRLINAEFSEKENPADLLWGATKVDFSEKEIAYDENGNILQLNRKGIMPGMTSPTYVDRLQYTYKSVAGGQWSNKLLKVFDNNPGLGASGNGKAGDFKDEIFNANTDDYQYDENGSLTADNNKKIRSGGIIYNYLGKPEKVVIENKSIIEYQYDAAGTKLSRKVTPTGGSPRTTYYADNFIYEENELKFIMYSEGRLRVITPLSSTSPAGATGIITSGNVQLLSDKSGVFDFLVRDHTGSVRMVLTEEFHKEIYKAGMENAAAAEEESIFGKVNNSGAPLHPGNELFDSRVDKPSGWSSNSSAKVIKLFSTGTSSSKSIGTNILLKVMAGDKLDAMASYYFDLPSSAPVNHNILNTVVSSLLGGFAGGGVSSAVKDGAGAIQGGLQDPGLSPLLPFFGNRPLPAGNGPKAYLNYIFFDENFNYVTQESGASLVGLQGNNGTVSKLALKVPQNGYAFVYLSNESELPVYFDDFNVSHERSAIVEEDHYYPTGMKIASISSRAFNAPENRYQYQGTYAEFDEETSLNDFYLRTQDPQIARFIQQDPYLEFSSPYVSMGNDPVNTIDPSGGLTVDFGELGRVTGSVLGDRLLAAAGGAVAGFLVSKLTGSDGWKGARYGAVAGFVATFIPPFDLEAISDVFYKLSSFVDAAGKVLEKAYMGTEFTKVINVVILHGIDDDNYDAAAGGKLGGHVMINFGNDVLYGFTGWGIRKKTSTPGSPDYRQVPLFPSKDTEGKKWFSSIHGSDYHGGMSLIKSGRRLEGGAEMELGVATVFEIPVSEEQFDELKKWYEDNLGKSPYPYTQFGMRCASSVYSGLKRVGAIGLAIPFNSTTNGFGPGFLFRYLWNRGYKHKTYMNLGKVDKNKVNFYNRKSLKKMADKQP